MIHKCVAFGMAPANCATVCFSNAVAGESAIDRFACGVGGKHMLPHIVATVPQMLQSGRLTTDLQEIEICMQVVPLFLSGCLSQNNLNS